MKSQIQVEWVLDTSTVPELEIQKNIVFAESKGFVFEAVL